MISRGYAGLPPHGRGQRIGLFGGSFNPAHQGHRDVSLLALRRLGLDAVWWLVTPGNPLKDRHDLAPLAARAAAARAVAAHPRIVVTTLEARLGSAYTWDVVAALTRRCPGVRFVWIMGADSFAAFHRWRRWRDIAAALPLAIVDRPGETLKASASPAATALVRARHGEAAARSMARAAPPAWVFLHGPRSPLSSTRIRAGGSTTSP